MVNKNADNQKGEEKEMKYDCPFANLVEGLADEEDIVICAATDSTCIHEEPIKGCIIYEEDDTITGKKIQKRKNRFY